MAKTDLYVTGADAELLTDKQRRFVAEYLIDFNASRAAKAAGYKSHPIAGAKLVHHKLIKKILGQMQRKQLDKCKLTREMVIEQLYYCVSRNLADFCDDDGKLITNVDSLNERARASVDGIKQTATTDKFGNTIITTELKLVPKASALDMAMKHKGLYAPDKQEVKHAFDWDTLYSTPDDIDTVEAAIKGIELNEDTKFTPSALREEEPDD